MIVLKDYEDNELDLSDFNGFHMPWSTDLAVQATFATNRLKVAGNDNILYFGTEHGPLEKDIVLISNIIDLEHISQTVDLLKDFLFDYEGNPKEVKMYQQFEVKDGAPRYRKIMIVGKIDAKSDLRFPEIKFRVETTDRFLYADTETVGSKTITGTSGSINLPNIGRPSNGTITITGTGTNVRVKANNKTVILGDITSGDTFVIDTEKYTVKINDSYKLITVPYGFLFVNSPIVIEGTSMNLNVNYRYLQRYL